MRLFSIFSLKCIQENLLPTHGKEIPQNWSRGDSHRPYDTQKRWKQTASQPDDKNLISSSTKAQNLSGMRFVSQSESEENPVLQFERKLQSASVGVTQA